MTAATCAIHVCMSCGDRAAVRDEIGAGGRDEVLAAIGAQLRAWPAGAAFRVVPQACFGPCGAGLRVAVTGPGRWGWLFQGLHPGPDIDAFGQFLAAWHAAPNGLPAKALRPARLLRRTVGRIPPSEFSVHEAPSAAIAPSFRTESRIP